MSLRERCNESFAGIALKSLFTVEVSEESEVNIKAIRDHLKNGSVVFYFNQISNTDGPVLIAVITKEMGPAINHLAVVGAYKDYDLARNLTSPSRLGQSLVMRFAPSFFNVETLPIVQAYDKDSYSNETDRMLLRWFIKRSREILRQPGGVFLLSPEGTRSPDGKLQKALTGIEHLGKYGNVVFVPIAHYSIGPYSREFSLGGNWVIKVGEMIPAEAVFRETIPKGLTNYADVLMLKLAAGLPEDIRGFYRNYFTK